MNLRHFGVGLFAAMVFGVTLGYVFFSGGSAKAAVIKEVTIPRPISDVDCGRTYQFDHIERFYVNDRVAVNFYFGGRDRDLQPQYIFDENVIGMSTEVRETRRVDRSLEYSRVKFLCLSDPMLEGHKASNIEVLRYQLTLRRPLRQQRVIRNGGLARQ